MADIDKIKIGSTTYNISPSWNNITDKPSTYPPASHAHSSILDSGDAHSTTFAYSKSGLNYDDYTWLAVWNGYELRSVNKSQFATSSHNHDGRYLRWNGSSADTNNMGWGTLTSTNGYTLLSHASSSDGGDWGMVNKDGKIFMQLDGYYYQNEGLSRVLDTSDSSSFAAAGHNHDDRYYTESEINSKLSGKSDTSHTHSYLPLSGGALTGTLDLKNSANGIKFNSKSHYITNIQVGSASITPSYSSGSSASATVTFQDYNKGNGHWYVVATAGDAGGSALPEAVNVTVSNITSSGFKITGRRFASGSGGNPTIRVDYIAIKFS